MQTPRTRTRTRTRTSKHNLLQLLNSKRRIDCVYFLSIGEDVDRDADQRVYIRDCMGEDTDRDAEQRLYNQILSE